MDLGNTISINDTEWVKVGPRKVRSSQKWKDQSRKDTHFDLVVSGFSKGTRGIQIAQYMANKDVDVIDWTLLTKREDATFLTFKVTVNLKDADKIQDIQFWPDGTCPPG